jgi:hypothetical protein
MNEANEVPRRGLPVAEIENERNPHTRRLVHTTGIYLLIPVWVHTHDAVLLRWRVWRAWECEYYYVPMVRISIE